MVDLFLNTNFTSKVEIILPAIDAMEHMMCNFYVDDSQGRHRYCMIIGCCILSKLNIDL